MTAKPILSKLSRKLVLGIVGNVVGGYVGKAAAESLDQAFHISESVANALDISADLVHASLDIGGASVGGLSGGYAAELLEEVIWDKKTIRSEAPPSNPNKGQYWYKNITRQLFVWSGFEWLELKLS